MARILAISSQVARGAVGLNLAVPALQRFGHEVIALPTILLSNHPGHVTHAKISVPPEDLTRLFDAIDANAWLNDLDAVLTGYLPSPDHVAAVLDTMRRVRAQNPNALLIADPVLGDDPKGLYIAADAAAAIRDRLLPEVDLATPNRFELAYLSGRKVESLDDAARALDCIGCGGGLATSIPAAGRSTLTNLLAFDGTLAATSVPRRATAPHGTGDLMSALFTGALLDRRASAPASPATALAIATRGVAGALEAAGISDALDPAYVAAMPLAGAWPIEEYLRREPPRRLPLG